MGTSTDGQLSYGVAFEDGVEFPWDDEKYEGDIGVWWRAVRGFINPIEDPYDERGNYKPGIDRHSPVISEYFKKQHEWEEENPIPVDVVNYCSGDYPMYILATKHMDANRGTPAAVDIEWLRDTDAALQSLRAFLEEFGIESDGEIRWWLSSYWG